MVTLTDEAMAKAIRVLDAALAKVRLPAEDEREAAMDTASRKPRSADGLIGRSHRQQVRRHPDIFTPAEAAAYLGLDSTESLRWLRDEFGLIGHRPAGKSFLYHRNDLDACALRMFGKDMDGKGGTSMKITGRRGQ